MRIDIGANSIRPELMPGKTTVDAYEMKSRGEHVRGRIIDVNQNIVLIQSSSGKEFTASTVVPMENFIGEEMAFVILIGSEGELLLKPELDDKKQNLLQELKIEDLLHKLNKAVTAENKQIIKNMIQSGIAINEDSFQEIKNLSLAVSMLQKTPEDAIGAEQFKLPLNLLIKTEDSGELPPAKPENAALPQEISLKEILTLKGLKLPVNLENLKALHEINQALTDRQSDIFGLKKLIEEHFGSETSGKMQFLPESPGKQEVLQNAESQVKTENTLDRAAPLSEALKSKLGLEKDLLSSKPEISNFEKDRDSKISREMLKELLSEISKDSVRDLGKKREDEILEKSSKEYLKLDVEKLSKDLRTVLDSLSKETELSRSIEREILPKTDVLREFLKEFQLHILPFQVEKYENIAQYYVKKNKKGNKREGGLTVAFSIDTFRYGNVRALLRYESSKMISVDILVEERKYEIPFKQALEELQTTLQSLGYTNINLSTGIMDSRQKSITEDKIYPNYEARSFETWV